MSDIYTIKRIGKSSVSRPSLVCTNCRRRKVGCDKLQPCTRCVKSNLAFSCRYTTTNNDNGISKPISPINKEFSQQRRLDNSLCTAKTIDIKHLSADTTQQNTRQNNIFFNYRSLAFKKPSFTEDKDHNITYCSPLSDESTFNNNKPFVKFESMFPYLDDLKEETRRQKEENELSSREILILNTVFNEAEVLGFINNFIIPNFEAINERIYYFNSDLKTGPFNSFLPVLTIYKKFNQCFRFENGKIIFQKKTGLSDYAEIAVALALVRVVILSTRHGNSVIFKTQLNIKYDTLSDSVLRFVSISSFRSKPTFDALLAIMIFRTSYFICDYVSINSNAKIFFELAIEMCFKLGVHVNCGAINGYTEDEVKSVWNDLQFIDGVVSIHTGEMLKLDYRYCIPNLYDYWEPIILYVRKLSDLFLSTRPISLNELLEMVDAVAHLLPIFKPFDKILDDTQYGPVQYLFSLTIKCDFIICYQILLFKIRLNIDELYNFPMEATAADIALIDEIKQKTEIQLFNSFFLTFEMMKKIANGDISLKHQSLKIMGMMKLFFSRFITTGNKICQLCIFSRDQPVQFKGFDSHNDRGISLAESEAFMRKEIDMISPRDYIFQVAAFYRNSISAISDYLMNFYHCVSNKSILLQGGTLALNFKVMLFICSLIKNLLDYRHNMNSPSNFQHSDWNNVVQKTTDMVSSQNNLAESRSEKHDQPEALQGNSSWAFLQDEEFKETLDGMVPALIPDVEKIGGFTPEDAQLYNIFF